MRRIGRTVGRPDRAALIAWGLRAAGDQLSIGERVAFYRRRRGLSQVVLADLVGRTGDWLSKIERGEREIRRLDVLADVARELRVTLGDLLGAPVLLAGETRAHHRRPHATPVISLKPAQEAEIRREVGVSASRLEKHRLTYHRHSAFHAFETSARGSLLLDEHFRCHPTIAAVSNEQFYGGKLTVLTDVAKLRRLPRQAILWAHISGDMCRRRGGSWVNEAEAERVHRSVDYLLEQLPTGSNVGVVTPFTAQAALLKKYWHGDDRVRVGTVHTFQGAQRDAMVFSLVAGKDMRSKTKSWLSGSLNLWNVANGGGSPRY